MDIYNLYRVKGHPVKYNYGLYIGKDRKTKYTQRITHRFYMRSYRIGYIEQHFFPQRKVLKIVKKWMRFTEDIKFEDQIPTIGKSLEKILKEEFLKLQKIVSEYLIDYLALQVHMFVAFLLMISQV